MRVVEWLRQNGHDAVHIRDRGLERLPNGGIFAMAVEENRVVLTFDLDFGEIVALSRGAKVSVIVFRLRNTRAPHVIDRLASALVQADAKAETATVTVIEEFRHRIRRFPDEVR
jgi:predicted nuclease of predicted toxin-antitoxin system